MCSSRWASSTTPRASRAYSSAASRSPREVAINDRSANASEAAFIPPIRSPTSEASANRASAVSSSPRINVARPRYARAEARNGLLPGSSRTASCAAWYIATAPPRDIVACTIAATDLSDGEPRNDGPVSGTWSAADAQRSAATGSPLSAAIHAAMSASPPFPATTSSPSRSSQRRRVALLPFR